MKRTIGKRAAAKRAAAAALGLASLSTCAGPGPSADLARLYDRVAQGAHETRNPVVLIPGVLGSRLRDRETGRVAWGAFEGDYADPRDAEGARLVALPMRAGATLAELRDGLVQDGALDRIHVRLFGLPIHVAAYVNILLALGVGGYRDETLGLAGAVDYGDEHFTCFQFAYDWRRDVSETAAELHAYLLEKREYIRREYAKRGISRDPIRFDVVAHSMGGLVLRYYLRYGARALADGDGGAPEPDWSGAELVERAVLIGTPNAGSIKSFEQLVGGFEPGPFLPRYPPAVLGTMPAIYQLLPRPRHGAWTGAGSPGEADALDPELWRRMGWGLADPAEEPTLARLLPEIPDAAQRRRVALDHQAKCLRRARKLFAALDAPASPPPGTELFLVAGDAIDTPQAVAIGAKGPPGRTAYAPGDGTVLRSSALMDERVGGEWGPVLVSPIHWARVLFLFEDHLGLTKSPAFIDNLLYLLLEEPR